MNGLAVVYEVDGEQVPSNRHVGWNEHPRKQVLVLQRDETIVPNVSLRLRVLMKKIQGAILVSAKNNKKLQK